MKELSAVAAVGDVLYALLFFFILLFVWAAAWPTKGLDEE